VSDHCLFHRQFKAAFGKESLDDISDFFCDLLYWSRDEEVICVVHEVDFHLGESCRKQVFDISGVILASVAIRHPLVAYPVLSGRGFLKDRSRLEELGKCRAVHGDILHEPIITLFIVRQFQLII